MLNKVVVAALAAVSFSAVAAQAATSTNTLTVTATITGTCTVSAATLAFGNILTTNANVDASSTIDVNCTTGLPYSVGLNEGSFAGATVSTRRMSGGGGTSLGYSLTTDAARTQNWDDVGGGNVASGTGTGATQNINLYGRVPVQISPPAGAFSDTVTITVSY